MLGIHVHWLCCLLATLAGTVSSLAPASSLGHAEQNCTASPSLKWPGSAFPTPAPWKFGSAPSYPACSSARCCTRVTLQTR